MPGAYAVARLSAALQAAGQGDWQRAFRIPENDDVPAGHSRTPLRPPAVYAVYARHRGRTARVAAVVVADNFGSRALWLAQCVHAAPCRRAVRGHSLAAVGVAIVKHLADWHGLQPPPPAETAGNAPNNARTGP